MMTTMMKRWFQGLWLATLLWACAAQATEVSAADAKSVKAVIEAQLKAFAEDDAKRAFSFAAPALQNMLGSPERFMAMVRTSYAVVYRPKSVLFLKPERSGDDEIVQAVYFTDDTGKAWAALYRLELQKDKSWRISACEVAPTQGRSV